MVAPLPQLDTAARRKARGAFFTPDALTRYVVEWAVRSASDRVLEPSCGEAAFLVAAGERLVELGMPSAVAASRLHGIEVHQHSARQAAKIMWSIGLDAQVTESDFFAVTAEPRYDAVIGNPPFIRYQDFSGTNRDRARAAALSAGVTLTGLASSWAAFTVHAAAFLRPGGRLGLVLPAELLSVNYAAAVRRFLTGRFRSLELVLFTERVFPGVQEEVVLLLADGFGSGPAAESAVTEAGSVRELRLADRRVWKPGEHSDKWTDALLPERAQDVYREISGGGSFTTLADWADTTLGIVTGNNTYFALTADQAGQHGIPGDELLPLSPPGSRHLRRLEFSREMLADHRAAGRPTYLFRPGGDPSPTARRYIASGEGAGVDTAYKCRVRSPWWRVPLVPRADLLLTYMNAGAPAICANGAGVHHLNSVHGLYLREGLDSLGRTVLPVASLNSATLLGAELVGRSYGGGMLKLEPREADRLPVLSAELADRAQSDLADLRAPVSELLAAGRFLSAVELVDSVLLMDHAQVGPAEVKALRNGHIRLRARRRARGAEPECGGGA